MMDEKEKCWCNDTGISFFVMCCKEMPVTLFLACAGYEMTDVVHKIQKEKYNTNYMLKNILIYGILHSTSLTIVDKRYKRKIYHLKQSSEGSMRNESLEI